VAADLGVADLTQFLGLVPHADVPGLLGNFSLFVCLSHSESFGVSVLEAEASGIPVVVSDVGGLPEVVRDGVTGRVVPVRSPASAASAILSLIDDEDQRGRMGAAGRPPALRMDGERAAHGTSLRDGPRAEPAGPARRARDGRRGVAVRSPTRAQRGDASVPSTDFRAMREDDVAQVAALHARVFPDYFLTHLGPECARMFYREFVGHAATPGFVAVRGKDIVGFVAGALHGPEFYRSFYRRRFWSLAWVAARKLITSRVVRREIARRVRRVCAAMPARISGKRDAASPRSAVKTRLISIGVAPEARGCRIAERLTTRLAETFRAAGASEMGLSVLPDNRGAIAFYEKTGWTHEGRTARLEFFRRSTLSL
jgi:ribosomal protein S18 acetylase RimI-like enzyme